VIAQLHAVDATRRAAVAPTWCGMARKRARRGAKRGNARVRQGTVLAKQYLRRSGMRNAGKNDRWRKRSMKPFDEMLQSGDMVRAPYARLKQWLDTQDPASLAQKAHDAEAVFRRTGITFAVYGDAQAAERLIPFDIVPRIISGAEWSRLSLGIEQRVMALNAFLDDIYHRQEIVRAGIVPKHLIAHNEAFIPEMIDFRPPGNVYTHIIGVDIVRTGEDQFYVLEDNARTPSGVSYMLENRETMMQLFPSCSSRSRCARSRPIRRCCASRSRPCARPAATPTIRPSPCSRPASTTPRTTNIRSSPTRWACISSKAAICR
jgi:hypothetical protein